MIQCLKQSTKGRALSDHS